MERKEANVPPPPARSRVLPVRPALAAWEPNLTSSTSSSSSSSFSPPDFLRHVQAALKRHRPLGMHANGPRARRVLVASGAAVPSADSMPSVADASSGGSLLLNVAAASSSSSDEGKGGLPLGREVETTPAPQGNASVTPPPSAGLMAAEQNGSLSLQEGGEALLECARQQRSTICCEAQNKVPCSPIAGDDVSTSVQGAAVTGKTNHSTRGDISSHMTSLALGERKGSSGLDPESKQQDFQPMEISGHSMMTGDAHMMDKRMEPGCNQHFADPTTQGSVASSSFTALSLQLGQAPQGNRATLAGVPMQMSSYEVKNEFRVQENVPPEAHGMVRKQGDQLEEQGKDPPFDDRIHEKVSGDAGILHSQISSVKDSSLNVGVGPSQSTKAEKASRKKKYDADSFFKVNGKFYQKLGKIGSGGSSEVYKVITSECTIYALKSIVLRGRDYSTAYGFYQEIEYLKRLKGKSNIIQLIDYEVTDEVLLGEVMNKYMSVKNGRIKDDVHIYMVLEYGEIDLAHMLLQKWKAFDRSNWKMDENWLRFYWQQMLEAVNTIHEERIVHSDLKPANFLLVRGSLKLIDFGIAKAISSDTTNIQRDSQVGTLNYMSPEAYMCNELDANGSTIKCGRPSDIWSLGCILYQMVYGKTPFAEYKTVWAKYKVVTDRNHQILYEPLSNPWLVDLMKKCLAWDRNERWRIPQLLQHPFLVPPIPQELPPPSDNTWNFLVKKIEVYSHVPEVSRLLLQFQKLIAELEEGLTNSHLRT